MMYSDRYCDLLSSIVNERCLPVIALSEDHNPYVNNNLYFATLLDSFNSALYKNDSKNF